jgi:type I restriction enzyme S subunit
MNQVDLGRLIAPAQVRRAGKSAYPVLSMTMREGLVDQADKFKKRVASADTASYKVVLRNQLVVGFPIDEGVLAFQRLYDAAIVSPAYNIWDLREGISVNSVFLERFLRSPRALEFYRSKLRSTTARRRSLPSDMFLSLAVPLPPLAEQVRIVKLLDEADELRRLRAKADRRTAALVPAIFHEMFGRHLKTPPILVSEVRAALPREWRWARLTEVARLATGHTPSRRIPAYWEGGTTPWITLTDIRKLDGIVAQTTSEFVTETGLKIPRQSNFRRARSAFLAPLPSGSSPLWAAKCAPLRIS